MRRNMQLDADPFSSEQWQPPAAMSGGTVEFITDEDDRSEVEQLKVKRRVARLAKEAAGGPLPHPRPSHRLQRHQHRRRRSHSQSPGPEPVWLHGP